VVVYRDRMVAVGIIRSTGDARASRFVVMRGRVGGPLGEAMPLGASVSQKVLADLDVSPSGLVTAIVELCFPGRRGCRLELYRWRDGEPPGRGRVIDRGRFGGAGGALDARGDALVAWVRRPRPSGPRDVYVRRVPLRGRLRAPRRIGTVLQATRFDVESTSTGQGAVAWLSQNTGEGGVASPGEIRLSLAGRGGRFGRGRLLQRLIGGSAQYVTYAGVSVDLPTEHGGVVAWTGMSGARWLVRAAEVRDARLGEAHVVSDSAADAQLGALVTTPSGGALIAMVDGIAGGNVTGPVRTIAATRPTDAARFSAPELVAEDAGHGYVMKAAIDPGTGRPVLAAFAGPPNAGRLVVIGREPIAP
jgi:hypothetical protein